MIRIAICDDDELFLGKLREIVDACVRKKMVNYDIKNFFSGEDLLVDIEYSGVYDIIFLDIELICMDGIHTAELLRKKYPLAILIFVSCHSNYYKAAFDVQPFGFIDKPINEEEIIKVCDKALVHISANIEKIDFYGDRIYYSLRVGDIIYLESDKRIIRVVCHDKSYDLYDKLENLEKYLEERTQRFLRIHKSYLVNANHIKEIGSAYVLMSNGDELTISRSQKNIIKEYMKGIILYSGKKV